MIHRVRLSMFLYCMIQVSGGLCEVLLGYLFGGLRFVAQISCKRLRKDLGAPTRYPRVLSLSRTKASKSLHVRPEMS